MIGLPKCPKCNEVLRLDEKSLKAMMSDTIKNEVKKDEI